MRVRGETDMRNTMWTALLGLVAAGGLAAAPAAAKSKDLCVTDSLNGAIKFSKVASLKKAGAIAALHGVLISLPAARGGGIDGGEGEGEGEGPIGSFVAPVVGTAFTEIEGTVRVGFYVLGDGVAPDSSTASASLITDEELNGSGVSDMDGDYVQSDAYSWTAADCDTLPFP